MRSALSPLPGLGIVGWRVPGGYAPPANIWRASGAKNNDFAIY
jgi:hypothetical protein